VPSAPYLVFMQPLLPPSALVPGARVWVAGSRSFSSPALVRSFVASLPAGVLVCCGSCSCARCGGAGCSSCGGVVDAAARSARLAAGFPVLCCPPEWGRFGRSAGPRRSAVLAVAGVACLVVFAAPGVLSPGSAAAVSLARAAGVPVVWG
jgi:hypothetical protein